MSFSSRCRGRRTLGIGSKCRNTLCAKHLFFLYVDYLSFLVFRFCLHRYVIATLTNALLVLDAAAAAARPTNATTMPPTMLPFRNVSMQTLVDSSGAPKAAGRDGCSSLAAWPDNQHVACSLAGSSLILVYNMLTDVVYPWVLNAAPEPQVIGLKQVQLTQLLWTSECLVAITDNSNAIYLLHISTGKPTSMKRHQGTVNAIAVSPDMRLLASIASDATPPRASGCSCPAQTSRRSCSAAATTTSLPSRAGFSARAANIPSFRPCLPATAR
jgi:hypothetical protein